MVNNTDMNASQKNVTAIIQTKATPIQPHDPRDLNETLTKEHINEIIAHEEQTSSNNDTNNELADSFHFKSSNHLNMTGDDATCYMERYTDLKGLDPN